VRFVAFDSPGPDPAEERLARARAATVGSPVASAVCLRRVASPDALWGEYAAVKAAGGEGLMLRRPGSGYEERRSWALLKVKAGEGA
jgi:DNA ligase-1